MKNLFILLSIAFLGALVFSSCEQCIQCTKHNSKGTTPDSTFEHCSTTVGNKSFEEGLKLGENDTIKYNCLQN